jgi:hypothetical protein
MIVSMRLSVRTSVSNLVIVHTLLPIFQSVPTNPRCAAARHTLTVAAMMADFAGMAYSILGRAAMVMASLGSPSLLVV